LADYRAPFGTDPPPVERIGIEADSHDTASAAVGFIRDLGWHRA
jgi:hypothetical protein